MEPKRQTTVDGQELAADDANAISGVASRATDRTLAELFRPAPNNTGGGAQTSKGIIPFGFYGSPAADADKGIVAPTGSADGKVLVAPFRALLGSVSAATPDTNWRDVRSAVHAGSDATKKPFARVSLAATAANNRWDLVWAKLTLDTTSVSDGRYVRDATLDTVTLTPSLPVELADSITIGVTQGVEGATPTRPSLPSDSAPDYYFPLAYVRLVHPHGGTTTLLSRQIQEVAPIIPLSRATGARTLQPGNSQYEPSGTVIASGGDFTNTTRPNAFLPSTMSGGEARFFAFDWDAATKTHPTGATTLIDDTIDWRNRAFHWRIQAADGASGDKFVWNGAATDNIPAATGIAGNKDWGFGQSFVDDGTVVAGTPGGVVAIANVTAIAATVYVIVDLSDGKLYVVVGADPSARLFLWLEATGPFANK